jgi:hypothetical protein
LQQLIINSLKQVQIYAAMNDPGIYKVFHVVKIRSLVIPARFYYTLKSQQQPPFTADISCSSISQT